MKKIWRVEWYNEDDYGVTSSLSVVVQGKELSSKGAIKLAKKVLNKTEGFYKKYEKVKATDLTDKTYLAYNEFSIC